MNLNVRRRTGTVFLVGLLLMALTSCVGTETNFSSVRRERGDENLVSGDSWKATLKPIAPGTGSGNASMKVDGASLTVEVETSGLAEGPYSQSIRSGTCPDSLGDALLSLDGDLSSEEAGNDMNPSSDVSGNYLYSESTDVSPVSTDLGGKIVVVYGTSDGETSTPVLCGIIEKADPVQEGNPIPPTSGTVQDQGQGQQQQQQQQMDQVEVSMPE